MVHWPMSRVTIPSVSEHFGAPYLPRAAELRDDTEPGELASYCLHALTAAGSLTSTAAVRRLVTVTVAGLRPPH
jgi:hypothetical protein